VNKTDLIARMAERFSGDRTAAATAVNGVLAEIEGSVARGERVSLTGFGTFERRERAGRTARNPRTGETIEVGPSVVPVFRAGTGFRALLGQGDGVSASTGSDAVEVNVPEADGAESRIAANGASGRKKSGKKESGKKESGKKARDEAADKGGKKGKGKGKKAAKAAA
jgi:DNA-binding protein HU-beta